MILIKKFSIQAHLKTCYQLKPLAQRVASQVGEDVKIEWYGDKDVRSYNVSFEKIRQLGFFAKHDAEYGVNEILVKLESGDLDKTIKTITLDWYNGNFNNFFFTFHF